MRVQGESPKNRRLVFLTAFSIPFLLAACQQTASRVQPTAGAASYSAGQTGPTTATATAPAGNIPTAAAGNLEYRISPQDMLEISVFQVPSLNRPVQVDGSGQISLPLIGGVTAGGKTVRQLESEITAKLGARYVQSPQVSVFVKEALGQRITIDGAVKRPGVYSAKSLLQALAQAGGVDELGDRDAVTVYRVAGEQRSGAKYSLNAIRSGQAADPPVYGGDTIVVDESGARVAWRAVKDVAGAARMVVP